MKSSGQQAVEAGRRINKPDGILERKGAYSKTKRQIENSMREPV